MTPQTTQGEPDATRPSRFQLYALDGRSDIRWRLLSANNRELGRAYSAYVTVAACLAALGEMLVALDELVAHVRPRTGNTWQWILLDGAEPVVVSSHSYERPGRSEAAAQQFRQHASAARIGVSVIETGSRRRFRTSISHLTMVRR